MKAFTRFRNEIWCMDPAHFDTPANDINGVKYLLVRQDLFDRTVDAKGMKTKDSKETVRKFLTTVTKENRDTVFWVEKWTDFSEEFKKLCTAEAIEFYSTMSETKAAFAERKIRSLKNILYRYMENYGDKYIHKLSQFVTTLNSRKKVSVDAVPKNVKISKFLYILYSKPLREYEKNPNLGLETEFASQCMTDLSGRVIWYSLHRKFWKLLHFLPENLRHTQ